MAEIVYFNEPLMVVFIMWVLWQYFALSFYASFQQARGLHVKPRVVHHLLP